MVHLVFVDPLASRKFLASSLKKAGLMVSAVYTVKEVTSSYFDFTEKLFDHTFYLNHQDDLPQLISQLSKLNVTRVYYGTEFSVDIADQLAQALCPEFANDPATSHYRANKFHMQEALRKAGLPHIKQLLVENTLTPDQFEELKGWVFPVIIKPVNCSASIGVEYCHTLEEIQQFLSNPAIFNLMGQSINQYLVQEYLTGVEYIVDTLSITGTHHLSGTLSTCRKVYNGTPLCLYSELVPSDHPDAVLCIDYTKKVLTAIGLNNGFGHTEVMLTARGPILIEVNPRISGANGYVNKLFQACGIPSQMDLLIADCRNNAAESQNDAVYGRRVCLQNYAERSIRELNLPLLKSLSSFIEADMLKKPGSMLSKPKTLIDTVAFVLLAHPNQQQVINDYQQLLNWESNLQLF